MEDVVCIVIGFSSYLNTIRLKILEYFLLQVTKLCNLSKFDFSMGLLLCYLPAKVGLKYIILNIPGLQGIHVASFS